MNASLISIAVTAALSAGVVSGQDYPNKPIRIVTSPAGGGTDIVARIIAKGITGGLGQPVIIDNRSTSLMAEVASKASPDGYTMLAAGGSFAVMPLLQKAPYDPVRDFAPISMLASAPLVMIVHPSLPVKSVKELIALAKAKPGELNYASGASGSSTHVSAALFVSMAGVNIVRIAHKGTTAALTAMLGGQLQLMFGTAGATVPHIKAGRLRALAITSAQPSALFPGMPTVAASGVPGYEYATGYTMLAPAGTPAAIINRLNQEIVRFLNTAEAKERFFNIGIDVVGSSPQKLAAIIKSDMAKMSRIIKESGIKVN